MTAPTPTAVPEEHREEVERLRHSATNSLLTRRDVVVVADSDPADATVWRQRLKPNGFSLLVIDKDGQVKQRKPSPWDVREIVRAIDKFPLRRQEIGRMGVMP